MWITDHIVTAHRFYRVSWLDSLMTLSHVAAVTERVKLGTSILILPTRQPAVLAKEVATLHYLSGHRYVYGIGTGWYGPEFTACGVDKSERGRADRRGARGDDGAVQRQARGVPRRRTTTSTAWSSSRASIRCRRSGRRAAASSPTMHRRSARR